MLNNVNINYIEYSITTRSLDIFFAGCNFRCEGCCNPELQDFNNGTCYLEWLPKIEKYLVDYKSLIDRVFLVGGSPNHQEPTNMGIFLEGLRKRCGNTTKIYVFCGEELETIQPVFKKYCDFIKTGAYIPSLKTENNIQQGIKLATSNQKINKKGVNY